MARHCTTPLARTFAVALLLAGLAACGDDATRAALTRAQATLASGLPAPYVEDLTIASVRVEGDALVQTIRSPLGDAIKTRRNPRIHELEQAEREALRDWCTDPAVQPLRTTQARLVRRFIDRKGRLFFEVAMPAAACPPPA